MRLFDAANSVDFAAYTEVFHGFCWTKEGANLKCVCPFHSDGKPSYVLKKSTNKGKCFSCDAGSHSLVDFIAAYMRIEPAKAAKLICEDMGLQYEENQKQGHLA